MVESTRFKSNMDHIEDAIAYLSQQVEGPLSEGYPFGDKLAFVDIIHNQSQSTSPATFLSSYEVGSVAVLMLRPLLLDLQDQPILCLSWHTQTR